jgi:hypothetical protein
MFLIFGTRTFGKVDRVPGLFYVTTRFFHINFVPLIPLGSYVIFEGTDRGKMIGFSLKSLAWAWGRWVLVIGGLICGLIAFVHLLGSLTTRDMELLLIGCGLGTLCVFFAGLFVASFFLNKASHERAMQLADELGWPRSRVASYLTPEGDRYEDDVPVLESARDYDDEYDRRWRDRDDNRRDRDYDDRD